MLVEWSPSQAMFFCGDPIDSPLATHAESYKVIGNIQENPDLVKKS
jgi:hypothetical protein